MNAIQTKHKLNFEACPWPKDKRMTSFRIGTCHGLYYFDDGCLKILSINNSELHNGHLEDVFEWFEYACRTQKLKLVIQEFFNKRFKKYCIEKRGFVEIQGTDDVIKSEFI